MKWLLHINSRIKTKSKPALKYDGLFIVIPILSKVLIKFTGLHFKPNIHF